MQYAVSPDSDELKSEIEVAKDAVSREVVIETSALALVTLLPQRWPALRSAFSAIRLPRPALADIDNARSELARAPGFPTPSAMTLRQTRLSAARLPSPSISGCTSGSSQSKRQPGSSY